MAAPVKTAASYKKKDGIVELSADRLTLSWKPATSNTPLLSISTSDITGELATPKVLRIYAGQLTNLSARSSANTSSEAASPQSRCCEQRWRSC